MKAGLTPILCVGEPLELRKSNTFKAYVLEQLKAVDKLCGQRALSQCVIAYEPIWAIGTGLTATPEQAQETHAAIRQYLGARLEEGKWTGKGEHGRGLGDDGGLGFTNLCGKVAVAEDMMVSVSVRVRMRVSV